ncbi:MAG: Flp family type IVb pilin [Pseudomonadota bacterium]
MRRFFTETNGATAVEYGLIIALLAVAIFVSLQSLGDGLSETFSTAEEKLKDART